MHCRKSLSLLPDRLQWHRVCLAVSHSFQAMCPLIPADNPNAFRKNPVRHPPSLHSPSPRHPHRLLHPPMRRFCGTLPLHRSAHINKNDPQLLKHPYRVSILCTTETHNNNRVQDFPVTDSLSLSF